MVREEVMELARRLDGYDTADGCGSCIAEGTKQCRLNDDCAVSVCKRVAMELYEIAGKEAEDATTVSAYDLLSDEDREALAWVREMGGVEAAKESIHQGAMEHGCLLKVAEMLGTSIYDGTSNADALLDKLEKRLMPAGCEWPRFEDGELVEFGDVVGLQSGAWMEHHVDEIMFNDDGSVEVFGDGNCISFERGETARRIVLAADGEPLEVGQTVYATHYGYAKCTVLAIEWVVDGYLVEVENEGGHKFRQTPDEFIHQRPVLDADGEPLEVGQTVWHVGNGVEFTVIGLPNPGEYQAVKLRLDDGAFTGLDPDQLTHQRPVLDEDGVPIKVGDTVWDIETGIEFEVTGIASAFEIRVKDESMKIGVWTTPCGFTHERPDSWERIEREIERGKTYTDELVLSIVRRCRALAERGA